MADRSVMITGGSGLIGSAVAKRLAGNFHILLADVKEPERRLSPRESFYEMDLTSETSVNGAVSRMRADHPEPIASVVHLAAYYDFSGEPSEMYEKVTVRGTERLIRALRNNAVEQFLFSSTMLVHQPTEPGRAINEEWPIEPNWDYPKSKTATEEVILRERGETPCVIMRIAGVYTDTCDSIPIAHQIQRINERQMTGHVYPGDISRGQAFVHLDDLVDAIDRAVARRDELEPETALLIAEPETYSYDELQRRIAWLIHSDEDWDTEQIPKVIAKTGAWVQNHIPGVEEPFIKPWMIDRADDHYEIDINRARTVLGWEPKRRLIDTLPKMIDSLKADPAAWYKRNHLEPPRAPWREHAMEAHAPGRGR